MTRINSIEVRNDETDVLKVLTTYAKVQGSKNSEMLYLVYTKLVYKTLNIESGLRGSFNSSQLSLIATIEIMIAQTVIKLMKQNIHYKEIYQIIKQKLEQFVDLISVQEIYDANKSCYKFDLAS